MVCLFAFVVVAACFVFMCAIVVQLLCKLPVFPGSFDFEAAQRICAEEKEEKESMQRNLDTLVRRGLVESFKTPPLPTLNVCCVLCMCVCMCVLWHLRFNMQLPENSDDKDEKNKDDGELEYGQFLIKAYSDRRYKLNPLIREFTQLGASVYRVSQTSVRSHANIHTHTVASSNHEPAWFQNIQLRFVKFYAAYVQPHIHPHIHPHTHNTTHMQRGGRAGQAVPSHIRIAGNHRTLHVVSFSAASAKQSGATEKPCEKGQSAIKGPRKQGKQRQGQGQRWQKEPGELEFGDRQDD